MAVVILGGLITSTILNLFLLPPLYAAYGRLSSPDGSRPFHAPPWLSDEAPEPELQRSPKGEPVARVG